MNLAEFGTPGPQAYRSLEGGYSITGRGWGFSVYTLGAGGRDDGDGNAGTDRNPER